MKHKPCLQTVRAPGPALDGRSVDDVLAAARASAAAQVLTGSDRVASTAAWDTADELIANLLAVYVTGASLVQMANLDSSLLDRRTVNEKLTRSIP